MLLTDRGLARRQRLAADLAAGAQGGGAGSLAKAFGGRVKGLVYIVVILKNGV